MGRMQSSWLGDRETPTTPCNNGDAGVSCGGRWHRPVGRSRARSGPVQHQPQESGARAGLRPAAGKGVRLLSSAVPPKAVGALGHLGSERSPRVAVGWVQGTGCCLCPASTVQAPAPPGIASRWPLPKLMEVVEEEDGCWRPGVRCTRARSWRHLAASSRCWLCSGFRFSH